MISAAFIALVGFTLSAHATGQIQSSNPAFANAGIQGCVAVADNADGSPLIIHDCNTEDLTNQDWEVNFWASTVGEGHSGTSVGPQQIKVFRDKCIDVAGGVIADNTKLQIWTCADNPNKLWTSLTDNSFQWAGTDKCIDLTDGMAMSPRFTRAPAATPIRSGLANRIPMLRNRAVHLIGGDDSANGGGPYCIAAASDTDGAEVALVACLNSDFHDTFPNGNITWSVPTEPLPGPVKTFNNKCLDVPGGSTTNGVKLQIWTCAEDSPNQQFTFHAGVSQIEWNGQKKCLDLTSGKSTSGNPIRLWDCAVPDTSNPNQQWFRASL
ncbi:ricin B lectin domain-containing protein [Mycena polygramma]|nr:ricin B lectin domain-containing protein [Mycena polygramma]